VQAAAGSASARHAAPVGRRRNCQPRCRAGSGGGVGAGVARGAAEAPVGGALALRALHHTYVTRSPDRSSERVTYRLFVTSAAHCRAVLVDVPNVPREG